MKVNRVNISGDPPMRLLLAFQQQFPDCSPEWVLQAPGRDMWVAACPASDAQFTLTVPDLDARTTFSFRSARTRTTVFNRPLPNWARYPAGALLHLRDTGLESMGLQATLAGSEPAGPRYDFAMGVTLAALWHEIHEHSYTPNSLIELLEQVRRDYVEAQV
jgi:hypothetical protein